MKKLLLLFLMAASLHGEDERVTGQKFRTWSELNRALYVAAYLDGYLQGHNSAVDEAASYVGNLVSNLSDSTRRTAAAELKAAMDKGVKEHMGLMCIFAKSHTYEQLPAIVVKYIEDHPERWDKPLKDLTEDAFIDACEKRAKNP